MTYIGHLLWTEAEISGLVDYFRLCGDLIEAFMILNGLIDVNPMKSLVLNDSGSTRGYNMNPF